FITSSGTGSEINAIKAILYAADNGAQIISASWGSPEFVQALSDAVQYAAGKNVLFVAAAGNDKTNVEKKAFYPAGFKLPNVISVAASSSSNARADFTNYGKSAVHVAAPGVDIYSTSMGKSYETKSGTSMATPIVSGVAALIRSIQPNLTVTDLRNAVLNATVDVGSWKNYVATDGLIQADLAVSQLSAGPQIWPKKLRIKAGDTVQFTAFKSSRAVWSSNSAAVAQVNAKGNVQALATGNALISFIDDAGQSHSATLEVVAK
ncbi:MAG: S8 family serine peptidase, partial [Bdellovibrionaceae bacterium]|nr:S8 family serine peptidase [Pseudobdellovibrionaceae bacterium]